MFRVVSTCTCTTHFILSKNAIVSTVIVLSLLYLNMVCLVPVIVLITSLYTNNAIYSNGIVRITLFDNSRVSPYNVTPRKIWLKAGHVLFPASNEIYNLFRV
jgi:hypothetical protein